MKDKSWIIILIMGIALAISLGYSIYINQKNANVGESTVTTTSIIEMTATTVTIKNTLTGTGTVALKEPKSNDSENIVGNVSGNIEDNDANENLTSEQSEDNDNKIYQITLSIEDKDLKKAKVGQNVEISIKKDEEVMSYDGKVIKINELANNKSTIDIEVLKVDEKVEENMQANCTVIIEKAENVVGIPAQAIQKNEKNEEFVDFVQEDGTTIPMLIKTGISDEYYVEVTYGLNVGDRVQIVKSTTTTVVDKENQNKNSER